jgi:hypothetical protein
MLSLQLFELAQNGRLSEQNIIINPKTRTEKRRNRKNGRLKLLF